MKNNKRVESFGEFNENSNSKLSKDASSSISDVIKSLTLEDITQIVGAFSDMNITEKMVREYIELNYL